MARNGRSGHIVGWGMYAPTYRRTNDEIARMVDTSDEWITTRTGIKERRIAADHESTATLATRAAEEALAVASIGPEEWPRRRQSIYSRRPPAWCRMPWEPTGPGPLT
jgi:hypothetical protein